MTDVNDDTDAEILEATRENELREVFGSTESFRKLWATDTPSAMVMKSSYRQAR